MKRITSLVICLLLTLGCLPLSAFAAPVVESELPFELTAPAYVYAEWQEGSDSPTSTIVSYSLENGITEFFELLQQAVENETKEEFLAQYGLDDIWINTQIDWAVDDVEDAVSGWHYNEFWDYGGYGIGYDEKYNMRLGPWDAAEEMLNPTVTANYVWVTRGVNEDGFNGNPDTNTPGLKDQLNEGQYEYKDAGDGDKALYIDYTEHTVYFRARFDVATRYTENEELVEKHYYSDWSDAAAVGKNAPSSGPVTKEDLTAPVITSLYLTDRDFNGCPVAAFTLTVPDELAQNVAKVTAKGGSIYIETYARVKGDAEWIQMQNAERNIKAGEMECPLLHLATGAHLTIEDDTEIELRCRYSCYQSDADDLFSDWSETLTFETTEMSALPDGVNYDDAGAVLRFKGGAEYAAVKNGTTTILPRAFERKPSLKYIFIPDSVTDIGDDAVLRCRNAVIVCSENSAAASYAEANGIPYTAIKSFLLNATEVRTDYLLEGELDTTGLQAKVILKNDDEVELSVADLTITGPDFNTAGKFDVKVEFMSFELSYEVTVRDFIWGDADANGAVEVNDVVRLKRYFAETDIKTGISSVTVGKGADANGDGKVTALDIIRLKKYFAVNDPLTGKPIILGPAPASQYGENEGWSEDIL